MGGSITQSGILRGSVKANGNLTGTIRPQGVLKGTISKPLIVGDNETVYIIKDDAGNELVGVLTDVKPVLDATANDIRKGVTAVTEEGITVGTKIIPKNYTTYGYKLVYPGDTFYIQLANKELSLADFAKLQVIICEYSGTTEESTSAEIVVIDNGVYNVQSPLKVADVTKDLENNTISLGITNTTTKDYVMRYITCKEV